MLAASLALSACLSNNVETLAPNMVRLNFAGANDPSNFDAFQELMQIAARETLARDYQLFRLMDWSLGQAPLDFSTQGSRVNFSVVVTMFRDGEQGSNAVFDARRIVAGEWALQHQQQ